MDGVRLDLADGGCSATGHSLLPLHAVLRTGLLAVADAGGVERPAHDLVAHARQVLDATAAHEHDRVLLQVVPLARDVGRDLDAAGDPDTRDLAQRRVRLLGRGRVHTRAHTAPLRGGDLLLTALAGLQARRGELLGLRRTALADELTGRGHAARDGSSTPVFAVVQGGTAEAWPPAPIPSSCSTNPGCQASPGDWSARPAISRASTAHCTSSISRDGPCGASAASRRSRASSAPGSSRGPSCRS